MPADRADERLVRLDDHPGRLEHQRRRRPRAPRRPRSPPRGVAGGPTSASPTPTDALTSREQDHDDQGEPMGGIRTNGMSRLPTIAPTVFDGEERARSPTRRAAPRRAAAPTPSGRRCPRTIVTGRTTSSAAAEQRPERLDRLARVERLGLPDARSTSPRRASTATAIWVTASSRSGSREARADDVEDRRTERDARSGRRRGSP